MVIMDYRICLDCSTRMKRTETICPNCGFDYEKFMNGEEDKDSKRPFSLFKRKIKKEKRPREIFSNVEALAMGIYPDDEAYKMSIMAQMYDED